MSDPRSDERLHWTREDLYFNGDDFFDEILRQIDLAKESVDLESYIFHQGQIATRFLEKLNQAQARGVRTRLLVDGLGSQTFIDSLKEAPKFGFKIFHPIKWTHLFFSPTFVALSWWPLARRALLRVNRRTHRKICIIDGRIAFVSSMNITDQHSKLASPKNHWRDTGVCVEGRGVSLLQYAFEHTWLRSHGFNRKRRFRDRLQLAKREREVLNFKGLRLNYTRQLRRNVKRDLYLRTRIAKSRLWITNPYFSPPYRFLLRLKRAAKRGVDVRLLIPEKSDVFFMSWVARAFYPTLFRSGIRIYEYRSTILHAKTMIVDNWATTGSSNLNYRSFEHDLECDVILQDSSSVEVLSQQFERDLLSAHEVYMTSGHLTRFESFMGQVIYLLFRHWI